MLGVTFDASWTGCALRKCCKAEEEEEERERDHMKMGPCAQRALGVSFDVSLAVLSGSVASVRRREREIVHMKTGPCARCALSVTFDASWTGCALRQGCKSEEERDRDRDCSHEDRPCARRAVGVTFDISLAGCPLRQGCKCDSMVSLAPAPDSSLQLVSRAEALGHHVRCRR